MPRRKSVGTPEDRTRFVGRLRETIAGFGSANGLATAAGVSEGALRKWMQGTSEPTRDRLVAIASAADVNVAWLATGNGPKDRAGREDTPLLEGFVALERVPDRDADGGERRIAGQDMAFSQDWVERHSGQTRPSLATVHVPDDSMAPLLPTGAVLVVDRSAAGISRDGIYALTLDGTLLVRRLQKMPGGQIEASAESATYQPFRFQPHDTDVTILGRAIWVGREL